MRNSPKIIAILSFLVSVGFGQQPSPTPTRQRVIVVGQSDVRTTATPNPTATPDKRVTVVVSSQLPKTTPTPMPQNTPNQFPSVGPTPIVMPTPAPLPTPNLIFRSLSFSQLKAKVSEAKREMHSRPMPTAMSSSFLLTDFVRVAFYNWNQQKLDYVVMFKTTFLSNSQDYTTTSANGTPITLRTLRANGVNTPVAIFDSTGRTHTPILVEYPVERGGKYYETAYYISSHPGVVTNETVAAGKIYVRNVIDLAREKLRQNGFFIQPRVADMAERLAMVEHVDHQRFRTELHPNIYNDVFTLYAMNEGDTYRYSVSSAGAGGMVQMIPSTYRMVRTKFFKVPLMPDFVDGMRNHVNASMAMLLYMQMTWNDLTANPTVANAVETGIATPEQLMAAGYNSNPARLPYYIKRGGANWANLIPRETKIYLQILDSLNRFVPMASRPQ